MRSYVPYVLKLVFFVILIAMLFSSLVGNNNTITFSSLIDWIENYHPAIDNFSFVDLTIQDDWGLFNGLKDFFNVIMQIFSFLVYIFKALVNAISYIGGFVQFLFAG